MWMMGRSVRSVGLSRIVPMPNGIYIVDDNAVIRKMVRTEFEDISGWEVRGEAVNGSVRG
jgi:hypothetical protein